MQSRHNKCWLPVVCLLILANCAKHKLVPLGASVPVPPTTSSSRHPTKAVAGSRPVQLEQKVIQAKRGVPEVSLLLEPPRMSFSSEGKVLREDVPLKIDITVLVDTGDGTLRADSAAIILIALKPLASQFLFLCPDQMRVGSTEDCRFSTKEELNDFFKEQLRALGLAAPQAAAVTVLVHADLTSQDKNAFDVRAVPENNPSSAEQRWRVVPRKPGDHKLELTVTPRARIVSARDVQGDPVEMVRYVTVVRVDNFLGDYGPAVIGCLAVLGLLAWIAWTLWRNARPSAFSTR